MTAICNYFIVYVPIYFHLNINGKKIIHFFFIFVIVNATGAGVSSSCGIHSSSTTRNANSIRLAFCKSSLNHVQLPYVRATHKFDFFILFLALWMDILTLICACGALARTMSVCLDAMTGGMVRIFILGRNAPINEPWPDVIGFSIIFVVSVMFMLGLEVRLDHRRERERVSGHHPIINQ